MKRVAFLIPYPIDHAPSQRFRFEQYFQFLADHTVHYSTHSFLNERGWAIVYKNGKDLTKVAMLLRGFIGRFFSLFKIIGSDFVFIHREAAPVGPPVFEWVIAKIFRKKIIYDFDDAIWLTDKKHENMLERFIRFRSKVGLICKWSYKVSCGNEYLCNYARQFNHQVILNPTTIDTEALHNPSLLAKEVSEKVTIGWTGSHSTLKYLKEIESTLINVEQKYPNIQLLVIADKKPELDIQSLMFIPWNKHTEAEDLAKIDIGIMPLPNDTWAQGKCGFKALQYMAMEIPTVASPVGVNTKIVDHGVDGYLATAPHEWITILEILINDAALRSTVGKKGRKKIVDHYSVLSNTSTFLGLFS